MVFLKQDFIDKLIQIKIEDLTLDQKVKFEDVLLSDLESFLIWEQLFKKFSYKFVFLNWTHQNLQSYMKETRPKIF